MGESRRLRRNDAQPHAMRRKHRGRDGRQGERSADL